MFFYETKKISVSTNEPNDFTFNPLNCDATKCFTEHYMNSLVLTFMANNGTIFEKNQAIKELEICERKMKYWKKQPHFNEKEALEFMKKHKVAC